MDKREVLPEGYRIRPYCVRGGDAADPYDSGEWTKVLEVYGTRIVGHWWWKRPVTRWWDVEYNPSEAVLVHSAQVRAKAKASG